MRLRLTLALAIALWPAVPACAQSLVIVNPTETSLACKTGDRLQISGAFNMIRDYDNCTFYADGSIVEQHGPTLNVDNYKFVWSVLSPGTHVLEVLYTMQPRGKAIARRIYVTATNGSPVAFKDLPAESGLNIPITVAASDPKLFPLARVDFYFRDQYLGAATSAPFSVLLPLETVPTTGNYPLRFIAHDAFGHTYNSQPVSIGIPDRIHAMIPSAVTSLKNGETIPTTCKIIEGLKVAKVAYWIAHPDESDWKQMSETTAVPFTGSVDMSAYATGPYHLKARATAASGTVIESPVSFFDFKNTPKDDASAKEAKAQAIVDAQLAKQKAADDASREAAAHIASEEAANLNLFLPRPGFDEKIFRHQLARLAYYQPQNRTGIVGTVEGLGVITTTNGLGEILRKRGSTLTITALVRPGTGQFSFLAYSEEDARISAQQAAEYCKMRTSVFRWDWSKYDLDVGFDDNSLKVGGPSAGLADAVAIMSAVMGQPVDASVAMTGAITLQGQVKPVGGVDYKALAAFDDPNLHTLIVPADTLTSETLSGLYSAFPSICFNRRIIMVQNVDQALRQSVIGWQNSDYLKEEQLIQGGLIHFAEGRDQAAIAAFDAAHDIDPNNWTTIFWKMMVKLTREQAQRDAAKTVHN